MKNKIPQYRQIEQDLTDKIASSYYKVGDALPTEAELVDRYGVSRVTVRKALDNLVAKDLVTRTPGIGTFVKKVPVTFKVPEHCSFTDEMTAQGKTVRTTVDEFRVEQAPPEICRLLEIPEGSSVYRFRRTRYADETAMQLENSWMSVDRFPDISVKILTGSKIEYFEKVQGKKISYNYHIVTPILPTDEVAALFGITALTPIIKVDNITRFEDGQIMDYTENIMNSPLYQLRYYKK